MKKVYKWEDLRSMCQWELTEQNAWVFSVEYRVGRPVPMRETRKIEGRWRTRLMDDREYTPDFWDFTPGRWFASADEAKAYIEASFVEHFNNCLLDQIDEVWNYRKRLGKKQREAKEVRDGAK